jgi:hypothetical protein
MGNQPDTPATYVVPVMHGGKGSLGTLKTSTAPGTYAPIALSHGRRVAPICSQNTLKAATLILSHHWCTRNYFFKFHLDTQ